MDSIRAITICQERLTQSFNKLLEGGGEMDAATRKAILSLTKASDQICGDRAKFDEQYRALVLDPISRFAIIFPDFEDLIRKRNAKLLDYDAARSRVRRQIEKPSSDADHLPKVLCPYDDYSFCLFSCNWRRRQLAKCMRNSMRQYLLLFRSYLRSPIRT